MDQDKIIQWNCRSIINKKSDLIHLLNKYEPFVVALCETCLKASYNFKISRYNIIREDRPDGYGGVAILIKNSVPYSIINLPTHSDDISIIAVNVNNICIVSVYIAHPSSSTSSEINHIFSLLPHPCLVLGDFNSQHQAWGSSISNCYGDDMIDIIDSHNLCTLNTGSPTRRSDPSQNTSVVDLSICTPSLASSLSWQTLPFTFGSDHYPIIITFPSNKFKSGNRISTRKYRLPDKKSDDWLKFKNCVQSKISFLPNITPGNENLCAVTLANVLNEAASEIFPKKL